MTTKDKLNAVYEAAKDMVLDDPSNQTMMRMMSHYRPKSTEDFDFADKWDALVRACNDVMQEVSDAE